MKKTSPFIIYDAAAGSGKTYTLVKEYLKIILNSKKEGYYKHLLAITFTNKAVTEMKQRIIDNLVLFSQPDAIENPSEMATQIAGETGLTSIQIQTQSKKIVKHLLHHYSNLNIETIDHFNHRLIRTFARDLKLSGNFEVCLDTSKLVSEAVDQLISKAGEDPNTTKVLLDFALEKTDDDKSWDISKDIVKTAGLLFNENDAIHIAKLKEKTLKDFTTFKHEILYKKKFLSEKIQNIAANTLQLIEESGLQYDDFSSKFLPNYFLKLKAGSFNVTFGLKWQEDMNNKPLYPGRVKKDTPEIAIIIDEITPVFISNFEETKELVPQILLLNSMLKNIIPLSVINLVNAEIDIIKEEKNVLPISEFNSLINNEIKDQPVPFIYERMGERYRHFFIDEFQDTSLLQWDNLKPLIDNALSQQFQNEETGSLLLVGDAKQSIYRWRGGLPEQFIGLCNDDNPFSIDKDIRQLPKNYRSYDEIIKFNNDFFTFIASYFGDPVHKELYGLGNRQQANKKKGGYVHFKFIESQNKEEKDELYAKHIFQTIVNLKERGYEESEICILTRKRKDGIVLGAYLLEQGISIISSETLLLKHSSLVQVLVDSLTLSLYPENEEIKINLLNFLHQHFSIKEEKHTFFNKFLTISTKDFSQLLNFYGIDFDISIMQSVPLYQSCEYCIRKFKLDLKADAYLFEFMDIVFEFEQQPKTSKILFLEEWEAQKENSSIPISSGKKGIQLMTIHKAKGLEFPIVLFPYADLNIYKEIEAKAWFPVTNDQSGFEETLINFNKDVEKYGAFGEEIYQKRRNTLELDNFNLLYVTLTRAIEQLYVYAEKPKEMKDNYPTSYNHLFVGFLKSIGQWNKTKDTYEFGSPIKLSFEKKSSKKKSFIPNFISTSPLKHNINIVTTEASVWETDAEKALFTGTLLHDTMEMIKNKEDVDFVFEDLINSGVIPLEVLQSLKETVSIIVTHPELSHFFEFSEKVINERDIITSAGTILRPDRLNFNKDNSVTVIDYKTGAPNTKHHAQINGYALALEEMGYNISEKILIYSINKDIVINKV